MSQKRLAELSGVSRATINYVRAGKSCSDEVGQKIADALGIDIVKILE
ncbi:MAG: helix-turn-helix transcriptional regulator [Lachnospiraceae bacterium]|nr:helix-turn-helix transcriptional regulator [Lachnospiraceae bacterium]MCI9299152.1 helix-turn-helix transcriptional regulator [Lachnospiraceae bacterium]